MSWWKRVLGLDGFDVTVHAAITAIILVWVRVVNTRAEDVVIFSGVTLITSLVFLAIRRRLALGRVERHRLNQVDAERLAELEQRLAELEYEVGRMAELEERMDFAERLLARRQDARVLEPGDQG